MIVHHLSILLILVLGCGSLTPPTTVGPDVGSSGPTGLEGTARRGPTRPVCRIDSPCDAPFSAGFEVLQGTQVVARFQSDSAGHFQVRLAPGTYKVVPDASVGILLRSQVQEVTVGPSGLTHVDLHFDTGIR